MILRNNNIHANENMRRVEFGYSGRHQIFRDKDDWLIVRDRSLHRRRAHQLAQNALPDIAQIHGAPGQHRIKVGRFVASIVNDYIRIVKAIAAKIILAFKPVKVL